MRLEISKRHSLGSEYVVVDVRAMPVAPTAFARLAQALCDRAGPIGADGAAFLIGAAGGSAERVRVFTPSGSESELCLNGLRCAARSLVSEAQRQRVLRAVESDVAAFLEPPFAGAVVSVALETPLPVYGLRPPHSLAASDAATPVVIDGIPFTPMTNGVPHLLGCVPSVDLSQLLRLGADLQDDPRFPTGMNVSLVTALDRGSFFVKTFERGGAGLTKACSSAIGAAARLLADRGDTTGERLTAVTSGGLSEVRVGASGLRLRANVTLVLDATVNTQDDGGAIDLVDARPATGETAAFAAWIAATNIDRLEHTIVV